MSCRMKILKCVVAAMLLVLLAMTAGAQGPQNITADADLDSARKVKDYYADWLSSIPGVSEVNVANSERGEPEIMVDVAQMTPQVKQIPAKLNGIPVVIKPLQQAESGSSLSSEPFGARGFMPSPTPQVEISPVPTPQANKFWPYPRRPFPINPNNP